MKSSLLIVVISSVLLIAASSPVRGEEVVTVEPARDDTMLLNPGKGWVQYYGPDKYTRDYISVGYTRWAWSALEPREGEYNWKEIDNFIKLFKGYGKKTAFGVMSVSTGLGQYVTPKWVFDAGAAPLEVPDAASPTGQQIIPRTWDDAVFLKKLKVFVQALGKRYDGNPDIAFIDIRDYGNWGEGHIGMLKAPGIVLTPPENLKTNYLLPYIEAFTHSQLIVVWGHGGYNGVYDWAIGKGAGIRRDGILSEWSKDGSECLPAHGRQPAVFEYCSGYSDMKKDGWWKPDVLKNTYFKGGKPSYMQWNSKIFEENRDFCLNLGNTVGYHFVLEKAVFPGSFQRSVPFQLKVQWLNDGVAFLYQPCHVAVALLDAQNRVTEKQWLSDANPRSWSPGERKTETANVKFTTAAPGPYRLAVGLFLSKEDANPAYRLGIQGRTAENWYVLQERAIIK